MIDAAEVRAALDEVRDPELDRSLVALEFVRSVAVVADDVHVELRLPTYWCSPSFAYMMVGDSERAVSALDGVGRVRIELVDHCAAREINEGIAAGMSFRERSPTTPTASSPSCDESSGARPSWCVRSRSSGRCARRSATRAPWA